MVQTGVSSSSDPCDLWLAKGVQISSVQTLLVTKPRSEQAGIFRLWSGLIVSQSKKPVKSSTPKPDRPHALVKGTTETVTKIGDAIFVLDLTINQWNEQLARAQPLVSGRVMIGFIKNQRVRLSDARVFDTAPVVGRMVAMKSGAWRFVRLTQRDVYTRLADLRVGKSLPGDAIVLRLINGIEDMLAQRQGLTDLLVPLRSGVPGKLSSILAACNRRSDEVINLSGRIRLDWQADAAGARRSIQAANHDKYVARQTRARRAQPSVGQ
jgi:hypothetical protein